MNWYQFREMIEHHCDVPGFVRYWRIYVAFFLGMFLAIGVVSLMTPIAILAGFGIAIASVILGILWQTKDTTFL